MFARIRIPSGEQQQLRIPAAYLKQMGELDVVWVLENGVAIRRFIRIGQQTGNDILVISGLSMGEQLILPSQLNAK